MADISFPSTPSPISPLCSELQISISQRTDDLADFVVYYPSSRLELSSLSRELSEIQMIARLLQHNAEGLDTGSVKLPLRLHNSLVALIEKAANSVLDEVEDALDSDGDGDGQERKQAWLEHTTERLTPLGRMAETIKVAMNLGLDSLLFAINHQPDAELPPYDSSQILQATYTLRDRLDHDSDNEDSRVQSQRTLLTEFVEALNEFIEQTSTSVIQPRDRGASLSTPSTGPPPATVSSLSSETEDVPDYHAIGIANPTPLRIALRHLAKKELSNNEIIQVTYLVRHSQPTIAVSTMVPPTRFFDMSANQVSCLSNQHGVDMLFARNGRHWSYLCEEDPKDLQAFLHDGVKFKKPVVYMGDYINGRRLQQARWPGVRPLAFSHDTHWLAIAGSRGRIALFDVRSGGALEKTILLNIHLDDVSLAVFTPDNSSLVTASRDGTIRLTNHHEQKSIAKLETDTWQKPLLLGVTPNSDVIVSIWGDTVFHWNHATAVLESYSLATRRQREGWPMAMSADCMFLCCRTDDGVDVSDLYSGRVLHTIKFQRGFATSAAFSWDGKYLILGKATNWMGMRVTMSTLDVWELLF